MDSNIVGFMYNASTLETMYQLVNKDDGFIDLGLSLNTLPPQASHSNATSQNLQLASMVVSGNYSDLIDWPDLHPTQLKSSSTTCSKYVGEDSEAVQSKERWAYVKVNMDGIVVGRKICLGDHVGYSSLALQLEDMFGRLSASGLRLFQTGSEFILFYKDKTENWRPAGDLPWKDFVDSVKRLRIVPKKRFSTLLRTSNE